MFKKESPDISFTWVQQLQLQPPNPTAAQEMSLPPRKPTTSPGTLSGEPGGMGEGKDTHFPKPQQGIRLLRGDGAREVQRQSRPAEFRRSWRQRSHFSSRHAAPVKADEAASFPRLL